MLGFTFSCQDEVIEETQTNEETIAPNSNLADLMRSTVTLDGSTDNIIDSANCILIDLPVTIMVNGITLTIETVEDYDAIEDIMDQFTNDDDEVDIQFPIVIILSDYTEVIIENQDELETYIDDCFGENEDDDDIECIDFQYPFTISIYDSNFQVIQTLEVNSDDELYYFIEELEGGVLASINFPINMVLANGDVIEVNNNTELEAAILAAEDDCDEDDDNDHNDDDECDTNLNDIEDFLYECPIEASIYDANDDIIDINQLEFVQNNEVIVNGTPAVTEVGSWTLEETSIGYILSISGLNTFDLIDGDWTLISCEDDNLIFTQDSGLGIRTMVFEMNCNNNTEPLGCLESNDIEMCDEDNDGFEVFNLYEGLSEIGGCTINNPVSVSFHTSLVDADSNTNPIASATSFTNTSSPQTIYVRIEVLNNPSEFEILEIGLFLEDCSTCDNPGTLTNDLILYMPFSEEAKDLISGNVVQNITNDFVEDRSGNATCAVAFNGNNSFSIPVTAQNQLVQGDDFSVSIWFKMQNTEVGDFEAIFQKGQANNEGFQMAVYDLNTPLVSDTTNGYGLWDDDWNGEVDVQWENTDWHHLVVTRDSNNTIRLYRDGVLRNIDENSSFDIDSDPLDNYILGQFLTGHLDDLRVYKRTLNPNDVSNLYYLEGDCYSCL